MVQGSSRLLSRVEYNPQPRTPTNPNPNRQAFPDATNTPVATAPKHLGQGGLEFRV